MENLTEISFSVDQIRSTDPTATHTIKQVYLALTEKSAPLTPLENSWVEGIEYLFKDKEEVNEENIQALMNEVHEILQGKPAWNDNERQLYTTVRKSLYADQPLGSHDSYFEQIDEVFSAMSKLEFSKRLPVLTLHGSDKNIFNYVATWLNMVNEELQRTVLSVNLTDLFFKHYEQQGLEMIVIGTRKDHSIYYINKYGEKILGKTRIDLYNQTVYTLFTPLADIDNFLLNQEAVQDIAIELDINNKPTAALLDIEPSYNTLGEIEGYAYTIRLANTNKHISGSAENFELAQLSHDIMTPLMCMSMDIESLEENYQKSLMYIRDIKGSQNRLTKKAQETLEVVTSKHRGLSVRPINFKEIINVEIEALLRYVAKQGENIDFKTHINHQKTFYSNPYKINNIVENLMANAVKYRRQNIHTVIEISTEDYKDGILLSIKDNGIGISDEDKERVLTQGYRVANNVKGYGMGLYMINSYITELKGTLSINSKLGEGSTFNIYLPSA